MGFALARQAPDRVACFVVGGATASGPSAYPAEPGKEPFLITALRVGPEAIIKVWGKEWMTPALRERLMANDTAAMIACQQRPRTTEEFSNVLGTIAVPALIYAGSADPIHDLARQTASNITGAQFVSLLGLNHTAANLRSDLVVCHIEPFLAKAAGR